MAELRSHLRVLAVAVGRQIDQGSVGEVGQLNG
jgi:hypothetical protein